MKPALLYFLLFNCLFATVLNAQMVGEVQERKSMYLLVMDDFLASGMVDSVAGFGVVDSTCQAVYYGGFTDSVNKKYFGFEAENYIDGELFRRNFVDATKVTELLPPEFIAEKGLIRIQKQVFRKCFTAPKQPQIILSEKGFEKLSKLFQTTIFCEFSLPYFVNENTVLIYFNYQDGMENDFPNVYLLTRKNHNWVLAARLRNWN